MIKVMIVDDQMIARSAIKKVLETDPAIIIAGEAMDGVDALKKIPDMQPDVITCDMEMPNMNGVQLMMKLRDLHPHIGVVVLSSITQPDSAKEKICLNLGAAAVLAKPGNAYAQLNPVQNAKELIQSLYKAKRK